MSQPTNLVTWQRAVRAANLGRNAAALARVLAKLAPPDLSAPVRLGLAELGRRARIGDDSNARRAARDLEVRNLIRREGSPGGGREVRNVWLTVPSDPGQLTPVNRPRSTDPGQLTPVRSPPLASPSSPDLLRDRSDLRTVSALTLSGGPTASGTGEPERTRQQAPETPPPAAPPFPRDPRPLSAAEERDAEAFLSATGCPQTAEQVETAWGRVELARIGALVARMTVPQRMDARRDLRDAFAKWRDRPSTPPPPLTDAERAALADRIASTAAAALPTARPGASTASSWGSWRSARRTVLAAASTPEERERAAAERRARLVADLGEEAVATTERHQAEARATHEAEKLGQTAKGASA